MRRVSSKGKMPTPKSLRSHEMPQPRHLAEEDVALQRGLQVGLQKNLGVSRPALLPARPLRCAQSVPRPWLPADAAVSNSGTAWKQIQKKSRGNASLENSTTTSVRLGPFRTAQSACQCLFEGLVDAGSQAIF